MPELQYFDKDLIHLEAAEVTTETNNPSQVEALMLIRASLSDPQGVLSNWDKYSVDACSWAMINCSSDYFVTGLNKARIQRHDDEDVRMLQSEIH